MVATALAGCFPVGLHLLWSGAQFSLAGKIVLTTVTAALSPVLVLLAVPVVLAGGVRLLTRLG
ncbi:MAG TPA: hypothetical protein VGL40_12910 [Bacillota bacterium]